MGYSTDFIGNFDIEPALTKEQFDYLIALSQTRRMKRNASLLEDNLTFPDPLREAVGLPVGENGCFYVRSTKNWGQDHDCPSIIDYNDPPLAELSLWCGWTPETLDSIAWNGNEKFYEYIAWIKFIVKSIIKPWGLMLNGEVEWKGEDSEDMGKIIIKDNEIEIFDAVITYESRKIY